MLQDDYHMQNCRIMIRENERLSSLVHLFYILPRINYIKIVIFFLCLALPVKLNTKHCCLILHDAKKSCALESPNSRQILMLKGNKKKGPFSCYLLDLYDVRGVSLKLYTFLMGNFDCRVTIS